MSPKQVPATYLGGLLPPLPCELKARGARATAPPAWEEDKILNRRILIVGGEFSMGSAKGRVRVSSFRMQQHEVTNEEYARFDSKHSFPDRRKKHPVVKVPWSSAMAYATWLGGSLPTEAQWEFAARGTEGREYPWGDKPPTCKLANFGGCGGPKAVGIHPSGATPEGVEDLSGNVWEWCRDWYGSYPERNEMEVDPLGPPRGFSRVLRGGSFVVGPDYLRGAFRDVFPPGVGSVDFGFRVVWSAAGGLD